MQDGSVFVPSGIYGVYLYQGTAKNSLSMTF